MGARLRLPLAAVVASALVAAAAAQDPSVGWLVTTGGPPPPPSSPAAPPGLNGVPIATAATCKPPGAVCLYDLLPCCDGSPCNYWVRGGGAAGGGAARGVGAHGGGR